MGRAPRVEIGLLGRFTVAVGGVPVPDRAWSRRQATGLVKLLALAPGRRLHREVVIDALWPEATLAEAGPRLHKAAHFARRALGRPDAVVLADDTVALLPDADVEVDVDAFEAAAAGDVDRALALYPGPLLPGDLYEPWADAPRERLRRLHLDLLRKASRWDDLLALEPTDEAAALALMQADLERGDRTAALRRYDDLERALRDDLDVEPSRTARALRDDALAAEARAHRQRGGRELVQTIRFCRADDGSRLAWAEVGDGPPLVRAAHWMTHLEYDWESIVWRHWLHGLAERFTLVRYDERGCGLSEWDVEEFSLEAWVRDLEVVVDAAGLERFPLLGLSQGGAVAMEFAARHPDRVSRLVLYGSYLHGSRRRAQTEEQRRSALVLPELAELGWGRDDSTFRQVFAARFFPEGTQEQWRAFDELQRRTTSPGNAGRFVRAFGHIDVEATAPKVQAPTLVVHARGDLGPPIEQGRKVAALIPDSRFVSLESRNHLLLEHEPAWAQFLSEVERFLAP
jgi:DNA-binding SARP family transcriptional activator/pimeloyl-ACP methyl ester carboxylesterase